MHSSAGFTQCLVHYAVPAAGVDPAIRHDFRTLDEAKHVAKLLAGFFPDPVRALQGLNELLINAVEHGNLGMGFEEKTSLLRQGKWQEALAARSGVAPFVYRQAHAELYIEKQSVSVVIRDEGHGFDWRPFMDFSPERLTAPNGRGIALARTFGFSAVHYSDQGNEVRCTQHHTFSAAMQKSGDV